MSGRKRTRDSSPSPTREVPLPVATPENVPLPEEEEEEDSEEEEKVEDLPFRPHLNWQHVVLPYLPDNPIVQELVEAYSVRPRTRLFDLSDIVLEGGRCRLIDGEDPQLRSHPEGGKNSDNIIEASVVFDFLRSHRPNVEKEINVGDLIDCEDHRGVGLWYFDGTYFRGTHGDYGYWAPYAAFFMIDNGRRVDFFVGTKMECVRIPPGVQWEIVDGDRDQLCHYVKGKSTPYRCGLTDLSISGHDLWGEPVKICITEDGVKSVFYSGHCDAGPYEHETVKLISESPSKETSKTSVI